MESREHLLPRVSTNQNTDEMGKESLPSQREFSSVLLVGGGCDINQIAFHFTTNKKPNSSSTVLIATCLSSPFYLARSLTCPSPPPPPPPPPQLEIPTRMYFRSLVIMLMGYAYFFTLQFLYLISGLAH